MDYREFSSDQKPWTLKPQQRLVTFLIEHVYAVLILATIFLAILGFFIDL